MKAPPPPFPSLPDRETYEHQPPPPEGASHVMSTRRQVKPRRRMTPSMLYAVALFWSRCIFYLAPSSCSSPSFLPPPGHSLSGMLVFGSVVLAVAGNVLVARRYGRRVMSWAVSTENKHSSFVKREMYKGRSPHRRSSCRSTPSSSGPCRTFSAERGAQRMEEDKFCRPYCLYLLPK